MLFIRFYKDTQKGHSEDQSGPGLTLIAAQNPVKREKLPLLLLSQLFLGEGLLEGLMLEGLILEGLMLEGLVLVVPIQVAPQLVAGSSDRFVACWRSTHSKVRSVDLSGFCFRPDSWRIVKWEFSNERFYLLLAEKLLCRRFRPLSQKISIKSPFHENWDKNLVSANKSSPQSFKLLSNSAHSLPLQINHVQRNHRPNMIKWRTPSLFVLLTCWCVWKPSPPSPSSGKMASRGICLSWSGFPFDLMKLTQGGFF